MNRKTSALTLLVLFCFSLVCNSLQAEDFLARRPGYGYTTGHEFDQLEPVKKQLISKPTVIAPPPVVEHAGQKAKPGKSTTSRKVILVEPPEEFKESLTPIKTVKPLRPVKPQKPEPAVIKKAKPAKIVNLPGESKIKPTPPAAIAKVADPPPIREPVPARPTEIKARDPVPTPTVSHTTAQKAPPARPPQAPGLVSVSPALPAVGKGVQVSPVKVVAEPLGKPAPAISSAKAESALPPAVPPAKPAPVAPSAAKAVTKPAPVPSAASPLVVPPPEPVASPAMPHQPSAAAPTKTTDASETIVDKVKKDSSSRKTADAEPAKTVAATKSLPTQSVEVTTAAVDKGSVIYGVNSFDSGLRVEANSDLQGIVVEPGKSFSMSFRVTNMSGRPGNFTEEFNMPEGFELTFPPAEFSLEPMESFNSIVMVSVPNYLPAGEHQFTYNVYDPRDQSVRGSLSFSFKIMEMVDLKFVIEEKPNSIIDGESFAIKGKLFNNSNATFSVGLSLTQQKHFKVKVTPDKAILAPGGFVDLKIDGRTGVDNHRGSSLSTVLTARDLGRRDQRVLLKQGISIGFYTKANQKIDFKNYLPVVATVKMDSYDNEQSSQIELKGRGYLDNSGRRRIDFLMRDKPSGDAPNLRLNREEMSLQYDEERLKLRLGDHRFGVAKLSQAYLGRGIGIEYNPWNETSFGIIGFKTKWSNTPLEGKGVYVSHILNDRISFKLSHFVTDSDKYELSPEERFTTLAFTLKPDRYSTLRAEIGKKWGGDLVDKRDAAFSVNYTTQVRNYAIFSISHTDTGVIYAGKSVGNENTTTSVNVPIAKGLNGVVTYSSAKQSPLIKNAGNSAAKTDQLSSSINYRLNEKTSFRLSIIDSHQFDWLSEKYDVRDKTYRAGISHNGRRFSSSYSLDRRKELNQLSGTQTWRTSHRIQSLFRLRDSLILSGFAGTNRNVAQSDRPGNDSDNLGLSINWKLLDSLTAIMNYRETFYKSNDRSYLNLDFNLQYKYLENSVEFRATQNEYSNQSNMPVYYEISLSREFGIPVSRNNKIGALTGVVTEMLGSETKALGNITLLMANMAAVTNSNGKFVFADLAPGTYTLDIDRRSGWSGRVIVDTELR
ncbi:MAG: hypothetical protein CVV42_18070 [Candidatus Riflebacteria bacterium HGW-Riflebacteria-2]|jgi:hypothetical protein|nr:MAG: hypothetical protein CVV42_18070 [Candidatus Riflebacteria bacterium HGW-Riflebacteria-2]